MKKLIAVAVFLLIVAVPAFAGKATPLRGTWGTEDFSELQGVVLPTSGEVGVLISIQIDTNLGPAIHTVEVPYSTFVFKGNGGLHFHGLGSWDFGGGNVLYTQADGLLSSFHSGITLASEAVIGGEGNFSSASGKIHLSEFPDDAGSASGFVAGVILD